MTWLYVVEAGAENASTTVEHACRKTIVGVIIPRSQTHDGYQTACRAIRCQIPRDIPKLRPLPIRFPDNSTNTSVSSKHPSLSSVLP